jgi:hypothetical protein
MEINSMSRDESSAILKRASLLNKEATDLTPGARATLLLAAAIMAMAEAIPDEAITNHSFLEIFAGHPRLTELADSALRYSTAAKALADYSIECGSSIYMNMKEWQDA